MFPIDVDAVELRIRVQERRARLCETVPVRLGGGRVVKRRRIGPPSDRHDEFQARVLLLQQRNLIEQPGIPLEPIVGPDLGECIVHMRELVCRDVGERISI